MDNNAGILKEIESLKKEHRAVIVAHNYQMGEIQELADFVGDSLELAQLAARTEAEVIVFCGVHFMAETASILCPNKKILLPEPAAGCPMADMVTAAQLEEMKSKYPGALVVSYVNTTAEVKASSYICCTSANVVKVIKSLPQGEIIFTPDKYLGQYATNRTGRQMHLWKGFCPTHARITAQDIIRLKKEYPQAKVMVHPECLSEVAALADEVLSTGGMCRYARESAARQIIVGTEMGIIYRLKKENPQKQFISVSEQAICPNMKLITPQKVLDSLKNLEPEVKVAQDIREKAVVAVERMLDIV
ncbi:MAG: quinolinate synthase NadA [Chloroflexi bacterium]|nr:quinolinate synthase NadA [Chloroflexota bacterium]